jgi:sodium transport system permease protein
LLPGENFRDHDTFCRQIDAASMTLRNIALVAGREIRDHLRDRRTIAMMVILPLVLYPVMALTVYQLAQFLEEKPCRVLIVGSEYLQRCSGLPQLLDEHNLTLFHRSLFSDPRRQRLLRIVQPSDFGLPQDPQHLRSEVENLIASGTVDVAVWFPPGFGCFGLGLSEPVNDAGNPARPDSQGEGSGGDSPSWAATTPGEQPVGPEILYSTASDRSQIAYGRAQAVLDRWREQCRRHQLAARGIPQELIEPFPVAVADVAASVGRRGAALWARLLPVLLIIWAATGALYPAIDACAGEKERGTLETLLVSPAQRTEIVLGKLCAVSLFSAVTAMANVVSMMISGWFLLTSLPQFGPPPWSALGWLFLALLPVSLLSGALSLALAAQARSTREAQYYLMPLVLLTMPLVLLPVTAGVELTWGTSFIPLTGVVLVLKSFLAGQMSQSWIYLFPALGTTLVLCALSLRWAVNQFHSENILFREAEVISLPLVLRQVWSRRGPYLTPSQALLGAFAILLIKMIWSLRAAMPESFHEFATILVSTQLAAFALPAIFFACVFSRKPLKALNLGVAVDGRLIAAALLALLIQPACATLQQLFLRVWQPGDVVGPFLQKIQAIVDSGSTWELLLYLAILPSICEELAFRGLVLGGFIGARRFLLGMFLSALLFAMAHTWLVQQISAFLLGMVLAGIVLTTGSLWHAIVFHAIYNGGMLLAARAGADSVLHWLFAHAGQYFPGIGDYALPYALPIGSALIAVVLWWWAFGWKIHFSELPTAGLKPVP